MGLGSFGSARFGTAAGGGGGDWRPGGGSGARAGPAGSGGARSEKCSAAVLAGHHKIKIFCGLVSQIYSRPLPESPPAPAILSLEEEL
jgi:hypothetical protein